MRTGHWLIIGAVAIAATMMALSKLCIIGSACG